MKKIILSLLFLMMSCASVKPIRIESNPTGAKVFVYDDLQKKFVVVGETPFLLDKDEKSKIIKKDNNFVAFKVEKSGYVVEHLIYDLKTKKKITYLLQLKEIEIWSDREAEHSSKLANDIAKKVQQLNRFILTKKHSEALEVTKTLIEQYPKAFIFYDIKGSIHLLKGNRKEAIVSLKKSISLNPDNIETEKILKILEGEVQ